MQTNRELTTYQQAWQYLDELQMHKIKLGLEAMRMTLGRLGSPEMRCPAVHVAGTNGKGSVCSMLRSIMTRAGYKTGLFTSPHLSSVRERFRIDEHYISEPDFTRLMERVRQSLGPDKITYFECTTALAFSWFAENDCDLVILETGMGGRLDATNVILPLLSVITTISLDHEQYLGDTIASVAFEKAGIIKPGVPLISGVTDPEAAAVIEQRCREMSAAAAVRGRDFTMVPDTEGRWNFQATDGSVRVTDVPCGKDGAWQVDNTSCAVATAVLLRTCGFTIADEHIVEGLRHVSWPGRMEYLEIANGEIHSRPHQKIATSTIRFLLDGAHNPAGVAYLTQALANQFRYGRLFVIWGAMGDKEYGEMLRQIAAMADLLCLTRADSERSATPEELAAVLGPLDSARVEQFPAMGQALETVLRNATADDLVVVAGSLYLVGEFRKLLVGEVVD